MEIINFEEIAEDEFGKDKTQQVSWYMPKPNSRIIMNGASGSGKTNVLVNLIMKGEIKFDKLWLFAKDFTCDNKWRYVCKHMLKLTDDYFAENDVDPDMFFASTKANDIPFVNDLDPDRTHLIIFDDFVIDKEANKKIEDLFIRGRKRLNGGYIWYLTQSWYAVPKVIRLQANYAFLHKERNERDKLAIAYDLSGQMPLKEFIALYDEIMSEPYAYMVVDLETNEKALKYRCGLTGLYTGPLKK